MEPKKSEILKLSFIATLLIISPLIPTSLRPIYLYFLFNLLIIVLGAQAGLLSFFSKPSQDKKPITIPPKPKAANTQSSAPNEIPTNSNVGNIDSECGEKRPKVMEKCSSEKIAGVVNKVSRKVKKCPSTPSIFFIGGGGDEAEEVFDEYESDEGKEEEVEVEGKELFTKAETFIGNFYTQLKMQREESWKRIHGLYQKAF